MVCCDAAEPALDLGFALGRAAVFVFFFACVPAPVAFLTVLLVDFLEAPPAVVVVVAGAGGAAVVVAVAAEVGFVVAAAAAGGPGAVAAAAVGGGGVVVDMALTFVHREAVVFSVVRRKATTTPVSRVVL